MVVALASKAVRGAEELSFQELEESLTCQCGCGLTVHSCNHLQCPSAIPLRQEIRAQMALGKDRAGVLQHFADKYGEKILSAPPASGFNLAAWVTPFVAVGLGALFVAVTLLRWRRRTPAVVPMAEKAMRSDAAAAQRAEHEKTLERELEGFDP